MTTQTREQQTAALEKDWARTRAGKASSAATAPPTSCACAARCRSSTRWPSAAPRSCGTLVNTEPFVNTLGALTGNQAMQQVKAGLKAIYLSRLAGRRRRQQQRRDVSRPVAVLGRLGAQGRQEHQRDLPARRPDPVDAKARTTSTSSRPIVADAEAGFGGVLNAFELMKAMIDAGAAGVHFEDQLASVKKCGHMGGKVLVPTREAVRQAGRRAPGGRRDGRADDPARAHRRRSRRPGHQRRRRRTTSRS